MPDQATGKGDILIPKTSCSVFQSTNLDYVLRNLNIEQVVVCGQLTDQCVESAVRDGADLGYFVTVVDDACAAHSPEAHEKGLRGMSGFCRILQTEQVVHEIASAAAAASEGSAEEKKAGEVLPATPSDEMVLAYLRSKGMGDAADQLSKQLQQKNLK